MVLALFALVDTTLHKLIAPKYVMHYATTVLILTHATPASIHNQQESWISFVRALTALMMTI
jgi:hypothetical protein